MATQKVIVKSGDTERLVFDLPHVIERYEGLGWDVVRETKRKSTRKPKTKSDGSPITHPKDLD